jgi:hypothetical protein
MRRNPFCQAFDLESGHIVELRVNEAGPVYLMTPENLMRYCFGRDDYEAEGAIPLADPIELVARRAGRWFLVSEQQLLGTYRLRRGVHSTLGALKMRRVTPDVPPAA